MKLSDEIIREIEEAIPHHINYNNPNRINGRYLKIMDRLAISYTGAPGIRVSKLLDDYYKVVGVNNLDEAINRLKEEQ